MSLFLYAPAFLLLVIVVADGAQFADPDLRGHIRAGQAVLEQGYLAERGCLVEGELKSERQNGKSN